MEESSRDKNVEVTKYHAEQIVGNVLQWTLYATMSKTVPTARMKSTVVSTLAKALRNLHERGPIFAANWLAQFESKGAMKLVSGVNEIWAYIPHAQGVRFSAE